MLFFKHAPACAAFFLFIACSSAPHGSSLATNEDLKSAESKEDLEQRDMRWAKAYYNRH